jgi:hypothetical protein
MMLDTYTDEFATGTFGRSNPLSGIQTCRIEHACIQFGIGPVRILERGKAEVNEHSETQIHEFLLQLMQAFVLRRKCDGEYRQYDEKSQMLSHNYDHYIQQR